MSLPKLPCLKAISHGLVVACYLSLYAPWFILAEAEVGVSLMPGYWRLALLFVVAYGAGYFGHSPLQRLPFDLRRRMTVVGGLAGIFLVVVFVVLPLRPISELHFVWWLVMGVAAWLRGLRLGILPSDNVDMQRHLVLGAAGIAILMVFSQQMGWWEPVLTRSAPFLLFWLIGGLVATALTRLEELSERGDDQSVALARFWPPLLVGLAAAMLALAVVFSWVSPGLIRLLSWPARLIWYAVQTGLQLIGYLLGYVAQVLVWILRWLISPGEGVEFPAAEGFEAGEMVFEGEAHRLSPLILESLKWMVIAAIILSAVAFSAYLLLRAWQRRMAPITEEQRESYASAGALRDWSAERWRELMHGLRRRGGRLRAAYRSAPRSAVEIYHALLRLAASRGYLRPSASTPQQFQPQLERCFTGDGATMQEFLVAFTFEFYGEQPLQPERQRELNRTWEEFRRRVEAEGRAKPGASVHKVGLPPDSA